jgi:ribosomal protein S18 acetylase RimI-like enzyme
MKDGARTGEARIHIREYRGDDYRAVSAILHATGFLGEDLAGTGLFNDSRLFALVNIDGYLRFQPSCCFVAIDEAEGKVVGYILGTTDSMRYERLFKTRMYWRIALRSFLVSWWKYPESFRQVLAWARHYSDAAETFFVDYPAHLHINVLPGCQRRGIGDGLLRRFEEHIAAQGVTGVHLGTSNRNSKALPFYGKNGYVVLVEKPAIYWRGVEDHRNIIFGKRLDAPAPLRMPWS